MKTSKYKPKLWESNFWPEDYGDTRNSADLGLVF